MPALLIVVLWAFAEATLFFIVADVPISAIGLRHGARRALGAAVVATLAAALGGAAVLAWSAANPGGSRAILDLVPGIGPATIDRAAHDYAVGGTWAMLRGSFGGVPYKLYAHAAGIGGAGMAGFFVASCIARLPRFALVALGSGALGDWLRPRISPRALGIAFTAAWAVFYGLYFAAVGW